MNLEEERELIRKIRGRDREALKRFFAYFYGRIFFLVKEKLGSKPGDTEDCLDLSSQILWETIVNIQNGNYDEEKGRLGQYLYGIVKNTCKNYFKLKKKNPHVSFSDLLPAYAKDNSEQELEKDLSLITYQQKLVEEGEKEMRRVLEEAIQNLEEKYKKLIYLKYYQELSYEEISRKENIPAGKVKSRLFEARKKLEKIILMKLNNLSNFSSEEGNI